MDNRQLRETCVEFAHAPRRRRPFFQMCEGDRCCRVLFSILNWMARLFTPASRPSPTCDTGWLSSPLVLPFCLGLIGGSGLFDPGTQSPGMSRVWHTKYLGRNRIISVLRKKDTVTQTVKYPRGAVPQATRSPGSSPAKKASRLSSARNPMASRVSAVALPIWGIKKVLGSSANRGSMVGSLL